MTPRMRMLICLLYISAIGLLLNDQVVADGRRDQLRAEALRAKAIIMELRQAIKRLTTCMQAAIREETMASHSAFRIASMGFQVSPPPGVLDPDTPFVWSWIERLLTEPGTQGEPPTRGEFAILNELLRPIEERLDRYDAALDAYLKALK